MQKDPVLNKVVVVVGKGTHLHFSTAWAGSGEVKGTAKRKYCWFPYYPGGLPILEKEKGGMDCLVGNKVGR